MPPKIGETKEKIDAGAGAGAGAMIKAPNTPQGVAASNAAGKTPFGRVIQVPNNTKKGYADGGEVEPETTWLGTPTYDQIVASAPPNIQLMQENPALAAQVAPTTLLQDVGASISGVLQAPAGRDQALAQQYGFSMPGQQQEAQTPVENVNLGQNTQEMAPQGGETAMQIPGAPGMDRYKGAMRAEAAAQGQLGNEQAALAQQEQARIQAVEADFQNNYKALESERAAIMEDIKASHIDPNRFIGQQGAGAKVGTAIGLLLSGFGSGLTGKENMAMQFLNKQIDNDIYAQVQELGKKNNLLSATMQQFGNLKDATQMARIITQDLYASKIKEAAARSMDPMAKARAEQAIAQMEMQQAPIMQKLAIKQTVMNGLKQGQVKPAEAVRVMVDEKDRTKAYDEIEKMETAQQISKNVGALFDQFEQTQTGANAITNPLQRSKRVDAMNVQLFSLLKPIFGTLSESDKAQALAAKIGVLDDAKTREIKRATMLRIAINNAGSTPVLDAYNIPVDKSFLTPPRTKLDKSMFGKK